MDRFFSPIHTILETLKKYFSDSHIPIEPLVLEDWAMTLYHTMSTTQRHYHNVSHILEILPGASPLESLAIIFHDIVYLQVDQGIHFKLFPYLKSIHFNELYQFFLPPSYDSELVLTAKVFGLQPGESLNPTNGLNEFLSALATAKILSPYLSPWQMIQILACIEHTIPFRTSPSHQLYQRLNSLNAELHLDRNTEEIHQAIKKAVRVANQDIKIFSSEDLKLFIENTWKLIWEGNFSSKNSIHTLNSYQITLLKIEHFFKKLNSNIVFSAYQDEPSPQLLAALKKKADFNIKTSLEYFQIQILAIGTLESIAQLTGGDVPMTFFIGENINFQSLLNWNLPEVSEKNSIIQELLHSTITPNYKIVSQLSHFANYLYARLTQAEREEIIHTIKKRASFESVLLSIPFPILHSILNMIASMTWSRRHSIHQLIQKLRKKS